MKIFTSLLFTIILTGFFFEEQASAVPVNANSQTTGTGGLCVACSVTNAGNATDGNNATYSVLNLTVGTLGAYVYETMSFPSTGPSGSYVGMVLEDDNLGVLDATVLGGLTFTTLTGGISNNDGHSAASLSLNLLAGSTTKYYVEFATSSSFDQVQVKINAGIAGALSKLRVYYVYYNASPLPVKFLYFNARAGKENMMLSWATATEINNDRFIVQRSSDGIHFSDITELKGKGFAQTSTVYGFSDTDIQAGTWYYRLMQVDFDGQCSFSQVISAISGQYLQPLQVNLVSDGGRRISMSLEVPAGQNEVFIKIYSISSGQLVFSGAAKGDQVTALKGELASGVYTVQASIHDKIIKSEKFSLVF